MDSGHPALVEGVYYSKDTKHRETPLSLPSSTMWTTAELELTPNAIVQHVKMHDLLGALLVYVTASSSLRSVV